jgi:hypothetical protein
MGRARKQIQPTEIPIVIRWLSNKLAGRWVEKDGYTAGEQPAFDRFADMKAEFDANERAQRVRLILSQSGESNDDFAHRKQAQRQTHQAVADYWTDFCERWLVSKDWTQLKAVLRQDKNRIKPQDGKPIRRVDVSNRVIEMLQVLTAMNDDCNNQSDVIEKYLTEPYDAVKDHYLKRLGDEQRQFVERLPRLDASALILMEAAEYKGLTSHSMPLDGTLDDLIPTVLINRMSFLELQRYQKKFAEQPGKWRGLAKRKWPELKDARQ